MPVDSITKAIIQSLVKPPIPDRDISAAEYPLTVPGIFGWYDGADADTITLETGVKIWADKSSEGNDVSQLTTSKQPSYIIAGQNGLNFLRFNLSQSQFLLRSSLTAAQSQPIWIVLCFRQATLNLARCFCDLNSSNLFNYIRLTGRPTTPYAIRGGTQSFDSSPIVGDNNFHVLSVKLSGASSTMYLDGSFVKTGTLSIVSAIELTIGAQQQGSTSFFDGDIFEMFLAKYDAGLADETAANSYLVNKWI
jgi:hypothetical protein